MLGLSMKLQEHTEFEIIDLGIVVDYVYDIEVENNHNFFGNGILVHNSVYVSLEPVVLKHGWETLDRHTQVEKIDEYEKTVMQPAIERFCTDMCNTVNGFEQRMFWEREVICVDGGIIQAKKRYALLVDNSEGVQYPHPKLKVKGLESNKSSTPEICVPWLKNCYELAIRNDPNAIYEAVKEYKTKYFSLAPADIATSSSVANVNKYRDGNTWNCIKGTPYQARAAITHNRLIEELNSETPLIADGSKIMIATLKDGNPYNSGYIAFQGYWPSEFEEPVKPWIDYAGNFEKSFLSPVQLFLDAVGMSTKPKVSVFSFFKK